MRRIFRQPHIRIIGADGTGKSALCQAIVESEPKFVAEHATNPVVYEWLRTHGVSRSSQITPDQLTARERIFMAANRLQMGMVREVTTERPFVGVRGRADTLITHALLQQRRVPQGLDQLFPQPYMRPDLLVVLTTPLSDIATRLETRGEQTTGANNLEHLARCQHAYENLGNLAGKLFPVLMFDTGALHNTPSRIANDLLGKARI